MIYIWHKSRQIFLFIHGLCLFFTKLDYHALEKDYHAKTRHEVKLLNKKGANFVKVIILSLKFAPFY